MFYLALSPEWTARTLVKPVSHRTDQYIVGALTRQMKVRTEWSLATRRPCSIVCPDVSTGVPDSCHQPDRAPTEQGLGRNRTHR